MAATLVWLRHDLRTEDNPALHAAVLRGEPVVPVFIWAPEEDAPWEPGGATRWWLHHALAALQERLTALGSPLVLRRGPSLDALRALARDTGANAVYWNRRYEPTAIARDAAIKRALRGNDIKSESFNGSLLVDPVTFKNKAGEPFKVFTPFWKAAARDVPVPDLLPAPAALKPPARPPKPLPLADLALLPSIDWADGLRATWQPGEAGAASALTAFLDGPVPDYPEARDRPAETGTSRLSPYLHFGEISPRQAVHALSAAALDGTSAAGAEAVIRQIYWREFSYYLLYHFPHTPEAPLREAFNAFPWQSDPAALRAWQRGQTGYPLVDAGMRELWHTGWMHNRVRMVVASFLVKHLLLPWQEGARWFWDTLVDADLANNTMGWQWTAGCGADAAPYFRIFNPVSQGEKFDPHAAYIRHWVPELAALPDALVHRPWEASEIELSAAGIHLGETYPHPLVEHTAARDRALAAYAHIKGT